MKRNLVLSRRAVIAGLGASVAVAGLPVRVNAALRDEWRSITAKPAEIFMLDPARDNRRTAVWGYDGVVPGPLLRCRQGGAVRVRLKNDLPQPTSIHWHGVAIDNRMDGVVGLTQDAVPVGGSFDYAFTVPHAGTYWYHTHNRSWEQMARGLYGVLIVDEPDPPAVDRDLLFVIDDWRIGRDGQIDAASFGDSHDWAHEGRLGNRLSVNGADRPEIPVTAGERIRLRCVNTANARVFRLDLLPHEATLIALDGYPLDTPKPVRDPFWLAPGQRADLIVDMDRDPTSRLAVRETSTGEAYDCAFFDYGADDRRGARKAHSDISLTPRPTPSGFDPRTAQRAGLRMTGGAMGMMGRAMHRGRMMDMRSLVGEGRMWAFNGVAGDLDEPMASIPLGRTALIDMINDTRWEHAMHLHGHHVRVVRRNGAEVAGAPWRDTVLMRPMERMTIAFLADNPGKWLFHCHMLEHQAGGMKTWIEVRA